jgi:hypothetical protein
MVEDGCHFACVARDPLGNDGTDGAIFGWRKHNFLAGDGNFGRYLSL